MSFDQSFDETEKGAPLVLPLRAFYARDPSHEQRRRQFYRAMAEAFEWSGWKAAPAARRRLGKGGRDGHPQEIVPGDRKNAAKRDIRAGTAEYLQTVKLLNDPTTILAPDREKRLAENFGDIRRSVARMIVDAHEMTTSRALKSPDWMKEGGASGGSTTPAEARLIAAEFLNEMRNAMPNEEASLIDRVFLQDVFAWEVDSVEARKVVLEDLRCALDFAAFAWGQLSAERMRRRWEKFRHLHILRPAMNRARKERA